MALRSPDLYFWFFFHLFTWERIKRAPLYTTEEEKRRRRRGGGKGGEVAKSDERRISSCVTEEEFMLADDVGVGVGVYLHI